MPERPRAISDHEDETLGGEPVQLSSLTARGLRFEWHEAVAIVQGICGLMRGSEAWESDVVPDADHVWLRSNGEMSVAPGSRRTGGSAAKAVSALARLLLSLVDEAQMPVQLRLVALSANSPAPPYASIEEFSRALAYFERPGRPAAIRDLYRRWRALPAEATAPAPAPAKPPEQAKKARPRSRRRTVVVVAAVVVVVGAAGGALWSFSGRPHFIQFSSISARVSSAVSQGLAAGGNLLRSGMAAVRERLAGDQTQTEAPPATKPVEAAARATPRGGRRSAPSEQSLAGPDAQRSGPPPTVTEPPIPSIPGLRAFDLGATVGMPDGNARSAWGMPASTPRQLAVDEQLVVPTFDAPGPVYTTADEDVVPATPVRPKLPTTLPPGTRVDNLSALDLLISESGDVLFVKLNPPARDVREAMMLSAAKAWRFAPATRNGRAVRFLKRIWIIMSSSRVNPG